MMPLSMLRWIHLPSPVAGGEAAWPAPANITSPKMSMKCTRRSTAFLPVWCRGRGQSGQLLRPEELDIMLSFQNFQASPARSHPWPGFLRKGC